MGKTTKLTMFDSTYNPVTGCLNGCPYCYAKRIAERFAGFDENDFLNRNKYACIGYNGRNIYEVDAVMTRKTKNGDIQLAPYPFGFTPTLHYYKLTELREWKEPKDIFVCSMADLFGEAIPDMWIAWVMEACARYDQHRYFFLTKNPSRYIDLFNNLKELHKPHENWWFGTTVTNPDTEFFYRTDVNCFLSIEPIHADFKIELEPLKAYGIKWVIVGAETGNRVGKVKPEKEWIQNIKTVCRINGIPLFMKDSLRELMGDEFVQEKP